MEATISRYDCVFFLLHHILLTYSLRCGFTYTWVTRSSMLSGHPSSSFWHVDFDMCLAPRRRAHQICIKSPWNQVKSALEFHQKSPSNRHEISISIYTQSPCHFRFCCVQSLKPIQVALGASCCPCSKRDERRGNQGSGETAECLGVKSMVAWCRQRRGFHQHGDIIWFDRVWYEMTLYNETVCCLYIWYATSHRGWSGWWFLNQQIWTYDGD